MIYASKTPRDLNRDPLPWHCPGADEKYRIPEGEQQGCDRYVPRPEYDHVQHNQPNPILTAFRRRNFPAGYWAHRLGKGDLPVSVDEATPEQIAHARRVLSRLARLADQ